MVHSWSWTASKACVCKLRLFYAKPSRKQHIRTTMQIFLHDTIFFRERVKPALFLNKLDRLFLELNKDPEEVVFLVFSFS